MSYIFIGNIIYTCGVMIFKFINKAKVKDEWNGRGRWEKKKKMREEWEKQ